MGGAGKGPTEEGRGAAALGPTLTGRKISFFDKPFLQFLRFLRDFVLFVLVSQNIYSPPSSSPYMHDVICKCILNQLCASYSPVFI